MPEGPGRPGRHRGGGGRPRPARLRQPGGEDHGPRRRPARRHRPPAARPRRDRGRRHPDDPAVPPVRGPAPGFAAADLSTDWVAEAWDGPAERAAVVEAAAVAAAAVAAARRVLTSSRPATRRHPAPPTSRMGRRRPGRRRRSVASMTRRRVTDRATGDLVADVDRDRRVDPDRPRTRRAKTGPARDRGARPPAAGPASRSSSPAGGSSSRSRTRTSPTCGSGPPPAARRTRTTDRRTFVPSSRGASCRLRSTVGDGVEAGQRLLSVEAMKMENELRAPRAGDRRAGRRRSGPDGRARRHADRPRMTRPECSICLTDLSSSSRLTKDFHQKNAKQRTESL